jgi:hypothetical protein
MIYFSTRQKNSLLKKHLDGWVTFVYEYTHAREVLVSKKKKKRGS